MSAPGQLSMFEPTGETLASLARNHAEQADTLHRRAEAYDVRGFKSTARAMRAAAASSEEQAFVCEMALQFEQEAQL
jgi:hypothetical protein